MSETHIRSADFLNISMWIINRAEQIQQISILYHFVNITTLIITRN